MVENGKGYYKKSAIKLRIQNRIRTPAEPTNALDRLRQVMKGATKLPKV